MLTAQSIIFNAASQSLWEFTGATGAQGVIRMVMKMVVKMVIKMIVCMAIVISHN